MIAIIKLALIPNNTVTVEQEMLVIIVLRDGIAILDLILLIRHLFGGKNGSKIILIQ